MDRNDIVFWKETKKQRQSDFHERFNCSTFGIQPPLSGGLLTLPVSGRTLQISSILWQAVTRIPVLVPQILFGGHHLEGNGTGSTVSVQPTWSRKFKYKDWKGEQANYIGNKGKNWKAYRKSSEFFFICTFETWSMLYQREQAVQEPICARRFTPHAIVETVWSLCLQVLEVNPSLTKQS